MALALTAEVVRQLFPRALDGYVAALVNGARILDQYGINTPLRLTHFLAQGAAETGGFAITEEDGGYSAERLLAVFPHYFTRAQAIAYAKKPKMILSRTYANRLGNGSEMSGDGWTYRGRGMCQFTGKANYAARAAAAGFDLVKEPDKAADPSISLKIFCAEWSDLKLNDWADKGVTLAAVLACSRGINCGSPTSNIQPNGIKDRQTWFDTIWKALGDGAPAQVSPAADGILRRARKVRSCGRCNNGSRSLVIRPAP
jgi:putative chitinase